MESRVGNPLTEAPTGVPTRSCAVGGERCERERGWGHSRRAVQSVRPTVYVCAAGRVYFKPFNGPTRGGLAVAAQPHPVPFVKLARWSPDGLPMAYYSNPAQAPMLQDPSEMGVVRLVSQCYALSFAADVSLDVTLVGKGETRDGKNYMSLEDVKVVLMPGQLISQVENLFNGNKELSKFA